MLVNPGKEVARVHRVSKVAGRHGRSRCESADDALDSFHQLGKWRPVSRWDEQRPQVIVLDEAWELLVGSQAGAIYAGQVQHVGQAGAGDRCCHVRNQGAHKAGRSSCAQKTSGCVMAQIPVL